MATSRIELDVEDRKLLEGWSRAQRVEHRLKIRSQIILKVGAFRLTRSLPARPPTLLVFI